MIVTRKLNEQTWIDLNSPDKEEIDSVVISQGINPLLAKDFLAPTPKQTVEEFGESIYAVIHVPFFKNSQQEYFEQEIDFLITKNNLVTVRYESIDALHHFSKQIEVAEVLGRNQDSHLFFLVMQEVYKFAMDQVEYIQEEIKEVEKNIFKGLEKEMVWSISNTSRKILSINRTIGSQKIIWSSLIDSHGHIFGDKFVKDSKKLMGEWERIMILVKNISDTIDELRETNNSMLSTKQNEIMKIFTILAFVTLPLSLIAAVFGMNTQHSPLAGFAYDFYAVLGIMLVAGLAMFTYFKYKKWI